MSNSAVSERSEAAGLRVSVNETSQFTLVDSRVAENQSICTGTIDCREGGMGLQAANSAQVTVSRNEFSNNSVAIEDRSGFVGGARLIISGGTVDLDAHEYPLDVRFADGFESIGG